MLLNPKYCPWGVPNGNFNRFAVCVEFGIVHEGIGNQAGVEGS